MILDRCPVCEGRGTVPLDFYDEDGYMNNTEAFRDSEECRSCSGRGYVEKQPEDESSSLSEWSQVFQGWL